MNIEKTKLIKIVIIILVAIFAIIYYFFSNKKDDYNNILTNDVVIENTTTTKKAEEEKMIKVYVTGEVKKPGVIELKEGARIEDAINSAGGISEQANLKDINLAYEVEDGEKIYIPNISEDGSEEKEDLSSSSSSKSNSNTNGKVNINKATVAELTSVSGIGPSTAQKIIAYREEKEKFKTIEDIKKVSGIGEGTFQKIKDYISVK